MWGGRDPYVHTVRRRGVPLRPEEQRAEAEAQAAREARRRQRRADPAAWGYSSSGDAAHGSDGEGDTVDTHSEGEAGHRDEGDTSPNHVPVPEDEVVELVPAGRAETAPQPNTTEAGDGGGAAAEGAGEGGATDGRFCRICYDDEDGGESGFLFRPCRCAGTVALVHVNCLNTWRAQSANRNSAFQCDQCKYEYKFGAAQATKLNVMQLVGARWFSEIAAFIALITLIIVVGVVFDLFQLPAMIDFGEDVELPELGFPVRIFSLGSSAVGLVGLLLSFLSSGLMVSPCVGVCVNHHTRVCFSVGAWRSVIVTTEITVPLAEIVATT
eukprot:m.105507 g.105507  ORF g.105507 m.105507 type:complete len:326 (+) comp10551_c0_seq2:42-1019(+)